MKSQEFKMPIFGVGPIYVITCLILTIAGIWLHLNGYIYQGKIIKGKSIFYHSWDIHDYFGNIFMDTSSNSSENK